MSSFKEDKNKSLKFFKKNKDKLNSLCSGTFYSVESYDIDICKLLDGHSKIDLLFLKDNKIYPYAQRVNFNKFNYKHITIRYSRDNGNKIDDIEFTKSIEIFKDERRPLIAEWYLVIDSDDEFNIINYITYNKRIVFNYIKSHFEFFKTKRMKRNKDDGNEYFRLSYEDINQINNYYDTNNRRS
tara:strand:+ start:22 stop:573 length:552 start_codon:yes stop_codon:yes gene_type:complete